MTSPLDTEETAPDADPNPSEEAGTPPAPVPSRSSIALQLREAIAALLALAIAGSALWMLVDTYATVRQPIVVDEGVLDESRRPFYEARDRARLEQRGAQKDLVLVAMGLLGSVLGYYFGRVPAEHRAERAESAAAAAGQTATTAVANASISEERAGEERLRRADADRKVEDARRTTEAILPTLSLTRRRETLDVLGGAVGGAVDEPSAAAAQLRALLDRLR